MGLIERIRQIQEDQSKKAVKEKAENDAAIERERFAKEGIKNIDKQRQEIERQIVEKVLRGSGILKSFSKIEDKLLKNKYKNHEIINNPEKGGAWIVWSNDNFKYIPDCTVGGADGISGDSYHYICAKVDPDTETLTIKGSAIKELGKSEWMDEKIIEETLLDSFIHCGIYSTPYNDHESNPAAGIGA